MKNSLIFGYAASIISSIVITLWISFQPITSILWLLAPLIAPTILSFFIIYTRTKEIRDFIKSVNDTIIFTISTVITALLTFKTSGLESPEIFDRFMINNLGYVSICTYTILLVMKASVAFSESIDNYKNLS
ncbi:hypothetical protein [Pantoea sp. Cy-640]|uniref:hypothetical protein n=1 Tax=Pantoea sp. Cy-640 TaxID=2608353 RepID=UPI0014199B78|nr:hypothetical protein [Pantoea sp. Cy-640]NIG14195.1 hypothetical protein [Pantoea sp. Cy-640]